MICHSLSCQGFFLTIIIILLLLEYKSTRDKHVVFYVVGVAQCHGVAQCLK